MGGAVTMVAASQDLKADGVILVSPAVWGWRAMNPFYKSALWLTAHTLPCQTATGSGLDIWPSDNIEALRAYSRDPLNIKATRFDAMYGLVGLMDEAYDDAPRITCRCSISQAPTTRLFPRRRACKTMRHIEAPKRLAIYAKGWHMLLHDRQRERVYSDIVAWIGDHRAPLPSGEEVTKP